MLTVFCGTPRDGSMSTDWDRDCGFLCAAEAMAARRVEDRRALRVLGAQPAWLDFVDAQYREPPSERLLEHAIENRIDSCRATRVLFPLGLFHGDHRCVHRCALALMRRRPELEWIGYEDVPYRRMPGVLHRRLARLDAQGIVATPQPPASNARHHAIKREALAQYPSQLMALSTLGGPGHRDADSPEGLWTLQARPSTGH